MVYREGMNQWQRIAEVQELKEAMNKLTMEEEAAEKAAAVVQENESVNQVFFDPDGDQPAFNYDEFKKAAEAGRSTTNKNSSTSSSTNKQLNINKEPIKTFTADDGAQLKWDEATQEWIEYSDDIKASNNSSNNLTSNNNKKRSMHDSDSDNDEFDDVDHTSTSNLNNSNTTTATSNNNDDSNPTAADTKVKRKRSNKKKRGPNNWVYVTGLPADVTYDEVFAHFSKVCNLAKFLL